MKNQLLLISLTTTLLLGCSSTGNNSAAASASGANNEPKSWFCEGKSGAALEAGQKNESKDQSKDQSKDESKEWDCSQLTKQEIALRQVEQQKHKAEKTIKEEKEKAAEQLAAAKESARAKPSSNDQTDKKENTNGGQFLAIDATTPLYISLAYKPEKPTALLDLPETFWAIQIMAMQDQTALNSFVTDNQLFGVSGAKIESQGKLFYALLLGVYESRSIAEEAWESRPQSIRSLKPYFRDLGSLQNAIRNGENL